MGSKKPGKVKAAKATSAFEGINDFDVNLGDLASASASRSGNRLSSSSQLGGGLQDVQSRASQGLSNNLGFIGQTPTQQLQQLEAGNNSFFNLQSELNRRAAESALSDAQARFSQSGLENSTSRGAFEGQLANDALLRDLATRQSSIEFQNNQALQNANFQNAALQGLANIQAVPLGLANQNLLTAFGNRDQIAQFNAQQENNARLANAQLQTSRGSTLGSLLGAGITAASLIGAPFTGGASLAGLGAGGGLLSRSSRQPVALPAAAPAPQQNLLALSPNQFSSLVSAQRSPFLGQTFGGVG